MSQKAKWLASWRDPGVQSYGVVCLAALGVMLVVLQQKGLGRLSFLPILIGGVGLATRWSSGPPLLVLALGAVLSWPYFRSPRVQFNDLVLAAAVLAYVMGSYRLRSLVVHIFPPDPRRRRRLGRSKFRVVEQARPGHLVSRREIGLLVSSLPAWVLGVFMFWLLVPIEWGNPGLPFPWWRAMWLAWLLGLGLLITAGFLDYWQRRQMTPPEAALYLQDLVWNETRREQRRLNRWLAWARLRRPSRKDTP